MKSLLCCSVLVLFFLTSIASLSPVAAAKPRVRTVAPRAAAKAGVSYSSARLSRATNSIILSLQNLSSVAKVTYTLSYSANGIQQGVVGSVVPSGSADSRDLYLGTCSHGVCTPHSRIKNASLTITTILKSGGRSSKRYLLRI